MDVLLPFALILVAFFFLILRPQRSRARAAEQLQSRLAPGVEIMTTSGVFGTVKALRDDRVELEIAPGVTITIIKAAVGRVVTEDGAAEPAEEDEGATGTHGTDTTTGNDTTGNGNGTDGSDAGRRDTPGG